MSSVLSDHLSGFVKSVGSKQIIDQPHQFTSCKRKGTFFGIFGRLGRFEAEVLRKHSVVHLDTLCGFGEVILQIAIAGFNKPGFNAFEIAGLAFRPSEACVLGKRLLIRKALDVSNLRDEAGSEERADSGHRRQRLRNRSQMFFNGLLQGLGLFLKRADDSDVGRHRQVHGIGHRLGQAVGRAGGFLQCLRNFLRVLKAVFAAPGNERHEVLHRHVDESLDAGEVLHHRKARRRRFLAERPDRIAAELQEQVGQQEIGLPCQSLYNVETSPTEALQSRWVRST